MEGLKKCEKTHSVQRLSMFKKQCDLILFVLDEEDKKRQKASLI